MFTIITENNYNSIMDFDAWQGGVNKHLILSKKKD